MGSYEYVICLRLDLCLPTYSTTAPAVLGLWVIGYSEATTNELCGEVNCSAFDENE